MWIVAQSQMPTVGDFALLGAFTLVALLIVWRSGALKADSVTGPPRNIGNVTTRAILMLLLAAFALWMLILSGFQTFVQMKQKESGQQLGPPTLTAADWAFVSVVPGAAVTILLIIGHIFGKSGAAEELGFAPKQFPRGVLYGVIGFIVLLPIVNWALLFLDWFYNLAHIQHPNEHELLHILGETSGTGARIAIIAGATIVAPIFEEFIFRAHLQTLFVRLFTRKINGVPGVVLDLESAQGSGPASESVTRSNPHLYWLAIFISSLLFAAIHEPWMAPAIFVLSLCIGYVYQRTGNLWSAIVMHALFNIVNTVQFLSQTR